MTNCISRRACCVRKSYFVSIHFVVNSTKASQHTHTHANTHTHTHANTHTHISGCKLKLSKGVSNKGTSSFLVFKIRKRKMTDWVFNGFAKKRNSKLYGKSMYIYNMFIDWGYNVKKDRSKQLQFVFNFIFQTKFILQFPHLCCLYHSASISQSLSDVKWHDNANKGVL